MSLYIDSGTDDYYVLEADLGWIMWGKFPSGRLPTLGQHWLLKQFCLNHPVEHIQKPKLPKLYVRVETSTSYFIIHNQFVK